MLDVVGIHLRNAGCHFRARQVASEFEHLKTDSIVALNVVFALIHQVVVEAIASPDDLYIVDVVTVNGRHAYSAIVHLSSKDFVTEEVVAPESSIRIGEIVSIRDRDIWQLSK